MSVGIGLSGTSSTVKVLREIVASSLDIDRQLATLLQHRTWCGAPAPEHVLAFRHALIGMLSTSRSCAPAGVSSTCGWLKPLQALFPTGGQGLPPCWQHHLAGGGDTAAAIACYTKAGDTAAGLYANARRWPVQQALKLARGHETPPGTCCI